MSTKLSAGRVRSIYEFSKAYRNTHRVQAMCRVLGVAPSGYYEWVMHPFADRAKEDARLLRLIRASFTANQGIYGTPRALLGLREDGETGSKHRVCTPDARESIACPARLLLRSTLPAERQWQLAEASVKQN